MDRIALIIENNEPTNALVIAPGKEGDDWLNQNPNAVEVTDLDPMPGIGTGWKYDGEWIAPIALQLTREQIEEIRLREYQRNADPLFFKWQAGLATKEEWESARQLIQDTYPYPEFEVES